MPGTSDSGAPEATSAAGRVDRLHLLKQSLPGSPAVRSLCLLSTLCSSRKFSKSGSSWREVGGNSASLLGGRIYTYYWELLALAEDQGSAKPEILPQDFELYELMFTS